MVSYGLQSAYLRAKVLAGRVAVGREHHDVVAGGPQALDQALESVLHAAHVAERAGLLRMGTPPFSKMDTAAAQAGVETPSGRQTSEHVHHRREHAMTHITRGLRSESVAVTFEATAHELRRDV